MRTIRFGIIGCGLMGREFASAAARWMHLTKASARPEIVAVCDTNSDLMGWYRDNIPTLSQITTDYTELLANPDVEAVYCAVPHVLHAEIYPAILAAGKHLLGEKPFGMDQAQNATIMAALKARPDLLVRCSSEMPFYPGAQKVIDFVRSGACGRILEVESAFLHSSDINPDKVINWKRMVEVNGEYGCMGDLGMHVCHVPLRLGWKPARVQASLVKRVPDRPDGRGGRVPCRTWDNATITGMVEDADGQGRFPLVLKTWRIAPGESNTWSLRVLGMEGSACFSTKNPRQWQFMRYSAGGGQTWQVEDLGFTPQFPTITGGIFEFGFTDAIQQMWAAFVEELAGGTACGFGCATPEEAADHHALLTAALAAGLSGQAQDVDYPS
ncbi:Gfo/Idh/MocA family oxidoreductase [Thioclava sp. FTW29]|uniref:Gfo/Idh/MocA family oxidoreductase n=1 Tax=Thioclava litoralis TaxID=3076557 RepID=A0ABZ1E4N2_9RHOB|nr:Gfo/Idh/MocA family oxidoreductase [Thioclava sp. FTW29]